MLLWEVSSWYPVQQELQPKWSQTQNLMYCFIKVCKIREATEKLLHYFTKSPWILGLGSECESHLFLLPSISDLRPLGKDDYSQCEDPLGWLVIFPKLWHPSAQFGQRIVSSVVQLAWHLLARLGHGALSLSHGNALAMHTQKPALPGWKTVASWSHPLQRLATSWETWHPECCSVC